jgi:hypothetical protein
MGRRGQPPSWSLGLKMKSCRSVYNRGWRVELECSLLVDRDAARREIELIEPNDELCVVGQCSFLVSAEVGSGKECELRR